MAGKRDSWAGRRPEQEHGPDDGEREERRSWIRARFETRNGGKAQVEKTAGTSAVPSSTGAEQAPSDSVARFADGGPWRTESRYPNNLIRGEKKRLRMLSVDTAALMLIVVLIVLFVWALIVQTTSSSHKPVPTGNPNQAVWVERNTGLYFCPGDAAYGKGTGKFMTQREAMLLSYRPAFRTPCN